MRVKEDLIRVLLVDDCAMVLWGLGKLVESEPGMVLMGKATNCWEALRRAEESPNVIVLDLDVGGVSSLEIIPELIRRSAAAVLVHTGLRDTRLLEDAVILGAMGIVQKDQHAALILAAIECIHKGGAWHGQRADLSAAANDSAPTTAARRIPCALTLAERELIDTLATPWFPRYRSAKSEIPFGVVSLVELAALYTKLDVRNRADLFISIMQHNLTKGPAPFSA